MKPFNTILEETASELVIQKSRFITYLIPVRDEHQASLVLERIRKQHWDATHHVPAWILDNGGQKFSDDGEPGGTAGLPVLEALRHGTMINCMAVVVRYFGGVKLGTGGLVRAYGQAAREALDKANLYEVREYCHLQLNLEYTQLGRVQAYLSQADVTGITTAFADSVVMSCFVPVERSEALVADLTDMTHGSAVIRALDVSLLAVRGKEFIQYGMEDPA